MLVFLSPVSVDAAFLQHAQSQWFKGNWLTLKAADECDNNATYLRDRTLENIENVAQAEIDAHEDKDYSRDASSPPFDSLCLFKQFRH